MFGFHLSSYFVPPKSSYWKHDNRLLKHNDVTSKSVMRYSKGKAKHLSVFQVCYLKTHKHKSEFAGQKNKRRYLRRGRREYS